MVKRERQRYILFILITEEKAYFNKNDLLKSIWTSIWRFFGMKEANKIGLWLLELNLEEEFGIIRCSHETKEVIISALTLVKEINGKKIILSPVKTSGTIRSIKKIKNLIIK